MNDQPIVTVAVYTYNSSEFVLETLESIKAQTYPELNLIIADDCSTDNTVSLCKKWVNKNSTRFKKTKIIVPDQNTGVSANFNRGWDACETEYLKDIAGDDILLPNCIEDNINYVLKNPDSILVFSRMKSFGTNKERCKFIDETIYQYDFFSWSRQKQYEYLINEGNCIPAPTCFTNIKKAKAKGLCHDERIPLQEDVPKWFNALEIGIHFHFFDETTVMYRVHDNALSTATIQAPKSKESCILTWFYYNFTKEYKTNPDTAIKKAVETQMYFYTQYYNEVMNIRLSKRYKIVDKFLFRPFDYIKAIFSKLWLYRKISK